MKKFTREQIIEKSNVTVGNNRTISVNKGVFCGFLHGHEIFQIKFDEHDPRAATVCLDTCGYETPTTRNAMHDFLDYFGIDARVSFAKGKIRIDYRAVNTIYYTIDNAPRVSTFPAMVHG